MSRIPSRLRSSDARRARARPTVATESGQTLPEYAIVVAAVAVAGVLALVLLAAGIGGLFERTGDAPGQQGPFVPPRTPHLSYPTKLADCEHGRWRNYAQFASEEECRRYVEGLAK